MKMENFSRVNLYLLLRNEFSNYESVLDIGCAGLFDLVNFEVSPFKRLIGVDKCFRTTPYGDYKRVKKVRYQKGLLEQFRARYDIHVADVFNFDLGINRHSLVICNKTLHFFDEVRRFELLERVQNSLLMDGLLYLKVNHNRHPNNTDPVKTVEIAKNVFQNKDVLNDIRFLVDSNDFLEKMNDKFNIISQYTIVDQKSVTLLVKK